MKTHKDKWYRAKLWRRFNVSVSDGSTRVGKWRRMGRVVEVQTGPMVFGEHPFVLDVI